MYRGLILGNTNTVPNSTYRKLNAAKATAVGMLWTGQPGKGGTQHTRAVYEVLESLFGKTLRYYVRVDGYDGNWWQAARDALAEIPDAILLEDRIVLVYQNEPNLEFWKDDPAGYVDAYFNIANKASIPVAACAPSFGNPALGIPYWGAMLAQAVHKHGRPANGGAFPLLVANLYDASVEAYAIHLEKHAVRFIIGEINSHPDVHGADRIEFLRKQLTYLESIGTEAALGFIADGVTGNAWHPGFIFTIEEAKAFAQSAETNGRDKPQMATPEFGDEFDPSPNYNERPAPKRIEGIVIHSTEGSFDATRAWFKRTDVGNKRVSSHYIIRKDGYCLQMVKEGDRAWHAGTEPEHRTGLWGNADFNGISIGIELEGYAGQPFTDAQYTTLKRLTWYLANKYQVPFDRLHIVAHSELSKAKQDPGSKFQWEKVLAVVTNPIDWEAEYRQLEKEFSEYKIQMVKHLEGALTAARRG